MEIDLAKIKPFPVLSFFTCVSTIFAGYGWLFMYKRDYFMTLDKFHITILAASLSLPILCFTFLATLIHHNNRIDKSKNDKKISTETHDENEEDDTSLFSFSAFGASLCTINSISLSAIFKLYYPELPAKLGVDIILITTIFAMAILSKSAFKIEFKKTENTKEG